MLVEHYNFRTFIEVVIRVKDVDVKGVEVFMVGDSTVDKDVATVGCELDSEYIYKTLIGFNIDKLSYPSISKSIIFITV